MSLELTRRFGIAERKGAPTPGHRQFGVPTGGAFDRESLATANALVGNDPNQEAWELGMAQARFRATETGVVSIVGATAIVMTGLESFECGVAFSIRGGQEFTVEAPSIGARVYIAWSRIEKPPTWRVRLHDSPTSVTNRGSLRVVAGPQSDRFPADALVTSFGVSQTADRVGIRLDRSIGAHSVELPSEPQCVGTIQISRDGIPILIGPDGPTIGGYPKIGVVISSDIDRVGQLRPTDVVRFQPCTLTEAAEINRNAREGAERALGLLRLALT